MVLCAPKNRRKLSLRGLCQTARWVMRASSAGREPLAHVAGLKVPFGCLNPARFGIALGVIGARRLAAPGAAYTLETASSSAGRAPPTQLVQRSLPTADRDHARPATAWRVGGPLRDEGPRHAGNDRVISATIADHALGPLPHVRDITAATCNQVEYTDAPHGEPGDREHLESTPRRPPPDPRGRAADRGFAGGFVKRAANPARTLSAATRPPRRSAPGLTANPVKPLDSRWARSSKTSMAQGLLDCPGKPGMTQCMVVRLCRDA